MVVTERYASLTDADLYASIWREGSIGGNVFLVRSEVLADIGSSYDSVEPSAVHVNGSDRFAIAFTRRNASFSRVRVFLSPEGSTSLGQGQWMILNEFVPGSRDSHPALSGSRDAGLTALLAVQSDLPNGGPHTIRGLWLNSATATINRAPFAIAFRKNIRSGANLMDAIEQIITDVKLMTQGEQEPYVSSKDLLKVKKLVLPVGGCGCGG